MYTSSSYLLINISYLRFSISLNANIGIAVTNSVLAKLESMNNYLEPLTLPTDRDILQRIDDKKRYTPKLVGLLLDKDPSYVASELRKLDSRGYVDDPAKEYEITDNRSGMYTLTNLGLVVRFHLPTYVRDYHRVFDSQSRLVLEKQPDNNFYPDLVILDDPERIALQELIRVDGVTIPSELHIEISHDADYSPRTASEALYGLYYHGLAERVEEMDVYRITERGEMAAELVLEDGSDPIELTEKLRETYSDKKWERLNALTD